MIIRAQNKEITNDADFSSLSSDATSGDSTISVYSISGFAVNYILLIGEFGQEGSEIIATSSSTSPTGTTVTLSAALSKSHPKDTKVYIIPYDQVEFYNSATLAGDKTTLTTIGIDPEKDETTYTDTTDSGYYYIRWYNSVSNTYSDYSDPIPYGGYGSNTVGYIVDKAMKELNKQFSDKLTYDMVIAEINACLRFIRGELRKWSNTEVFNYELDAALVENDYTWTLPSDYYDKNSSRSMLQIWLEGQDNLTYLDKQEFDDIDRDATAGKPHYFTVYSGSVYITPKVGSDYVGDSIFMDYYTDITEVDSDSDEITLARHDMVKHWVKWAIKNITERNGTPDYQDGDWTMFQVILNQAKRRETTGQKSKWNYKVSGITYRGTNNQSFDTE